MRWEHEDQAPWRDNPIPQKRTEVYPHAIFFDFESWQDKSKRCTPTPDLLLDSGQVPISVSIGDMLTNEVRHIVSEDPDELVALFVAALRQRADAIRADVWAQYCPYAPQCLPEGKHGGKSQAELIAEWCNKSQL